MAHGTRLIPNDPRFPCHPFRRCAPFRVLLSQYMAWPAFSIHCAAPCAGTSVLSPPARDALLILAFIAWGAFPQRPGRPPLAHPRAHIQGLCALATAVARALAAPPPAPEAVLAAAGLWLKRNPFGYVVLTLWLLPLGLFSPELVLAEVLQGLYRWHCRRVESPATGHAHAQGQRHGQTQAQPHTPAQEKGAEPGLAADSGVAAVAGGDLQVRKDVLLYCGCWLTEWLVAYRSFGKEEEFQQVRPNACPPVCVVSTRILASVVGVVT